MLHLSGRSRQSIEHSQKTPLASNTHSTVPIWCHYQARRKEYNYSLVVPIRRPNNWTTGRWQQQHQARLKPHLLMTRYECHYSSAKRISDPRALIVYLSLTDPHLEPHVPRLYLCTHMFPTTACSCELCVSGASIDWICVLGEQVNIDTQEETEIDKPTGPSHLLPTTLYYPRSSSGRLLLCTAEPRGYRTSSISTADRSTEAKRKVLEKCYKI